MILYGSSLLPVVRKRWPRATGYLDAILARPGFAPVVAAERRMLATAA